ncbi:hypothetical protein BKA66DRAFT_572982 [Pyrenochaeta sp. MPI-SDFR-AT-0127]|nr:hypothetical protein BKA66DRAFT_572982 [Pyrenochaeta sp. MPI-SDFR-AT-0127]
MPSIHASLPYLEDLPLYQVEKPYTVIQAAGTQQDEIDNEKTSNLQVKYANVTIHDTREHSHDLNIEMNGFVLLQHKTELVDFDSPANNHLYKCQTEQFLRKMLDAELRRTNSNTFKHDKIWDYNDTTDKGRPIEIVHTDHSFEAGINLCGEQLSFEQQEQFLTGDYRIRCINTWRPLNSVCENQPLAICTASSVDPEDVLECDRVMIDRPSEMYMLKHNPGHQWYWTEHQTSEEIYVFVTWDSEDCGRQRHCPHTSFRNERAKSGAPLRESVETRSIVVTRKNASKN